MQLEGRGAVRKEPTLSLPLRCFMGGVAVAGGLTLALCIYALRDAPLPLGWLLVSALALAAGWFALKMPGVPVYLSISDTFHITSCLLFGPAPATLTIALDSLGMSLRRGNPAHQVLFNTTSCALSLWSAGQVFFWLSGTGPLLNIDAAPGAATMLFVLAMAVVYFVCNSGLIAVAVALQKGASIVSIWREHFAVVAFSHLAAGSASFVLLVLLRAVSPLALAAVLPLLVIFQLAMRSWVGRLDDAANHVAKITRLYLSTVSALATAIEAKDGVTSDHIHRVRGYAMGLAPVLGVTDPSTLQAIEAAALLHDTGKLAIPEHILNKPGKLTPSEFETMKTHVDIGADILSSIDFPYPVIPIVRAHHENWDGTGYPAGLRGEEIPIGARILSVVDCFDALTSDRPYRPAMATADADAILMERRGSMYDPAVVDAFLRVRDQIKVADPSPQLQKAFGRIQSAREVVATLVPQEAVPPTQGASGEMLALVSLARVASQTPTIGDVGTLSWCHIHQMVPRASVGLFVMDSSRNEIVVGFAAGSAANRLAGLAIRLGERASGWAAANGRSAVNSDARLDLTDRFDDARFLLAVPLTAQGAVVGVMTLYAPEPFDDNQSRMMEMIAPHLAVSVAAALSRANDGVSNLKTDGSRTRESSLKVVSRRG
jgi:putative nucleotidyltransferase with HDIG domain